MPEDVRDCGHETGLIRRRAPEGVVRDTGLAAQESE